MENIVLKASDGYALSLAVFESEHPRGYIQIIHGMEEHKERYEAFAEQLRQAGFSIQVFPVLRGILCNDNQFRYATFCKPVGFFQHCFHRYAAVWASNLRNCTVAATIAASLCNL